MAQSTTNLGKIHVFPSEALYNQFKDIIADNDLALLKDDGAYIVAALLEQNGYVKFSNGLILQWGYNNTNYAASVTFPIAFTQSCYAIAIGPHNRVTGNVVAQNITNRKFSLTAPASDDCAQARWIAIGV